jgi:hypothetical protein
MFYLSQHTAHAAPEAQMFQKTSTEALEEALVVIRDATPVEVDTLLVEQLAKVARIQHHIDGLRKRLAIPGMDDVAENERKLDTAIRALEGPHEKIDALEDIFRGRGGWTRAFKVVSSDGHIHKSTDCPSCYPSTQFAWLPQVAGMAEEEIVALAGEKACTVCYASAPVDVRHKPCSLFTEEEVRAAEAKKREKTEQDAAKAAKGITNPDGTKLHVADYDGDTVIVKTETVAQRMYVELTVLSLSGRWFTRSEKYRADAETVLVALAHKRGTTVAEQRFLLWDKVIAKAKRDGYDRARSTAQASKDAQQVQRIYTAPQGE